MREQFIIGMDIGGTNIRIGAVAQDDRVLAFEKIRTSDVFHGENAGEQLIRLIERFLAKHDQGGGISSISIGFPATLDRKRTTVLQAPSVAGLNGLNVVALLKEAFQVPICIEKDVCTAIYYDRRKYCIPDCEVLLGIYVGTGIGNIIFVDGRELIGKNGAAGELGHISAMGSDTLCGCGNRGCVETLTGGRYLAELCRTEFPTVSVADIFTTLNNHPLIVSYIDRLAKVITTEINIFDPDYILLGGGVLAMRGFPMGALIDQIHRYTRKPYPDSGLNLLIAEDDEQKGVVGAALYAEEQFGTANR